MIVTREKAEFKPITIRLTKKSEVSAMLAMIEELEPDHVICAHITAEDKVFMSDLKNALKKLQQ